ncbi:hypothetical protein JAAARDRAFT_94162, partial [Jaapia argillacea MUCL 33604]
TDQYDLALIQEPYVDLRGNSRLLSQWYPVYPSTHFDKPGETQSLMLVNRLIPLDNWSQLNIPSPDLTAIQMVDQRCTIIIINIYNDQNHTRTLKTLK